MRQEILLAVSSARMGSLIMSLMMYFYWHLKGSNFPNFQIFSKTTMELNVLAFFSLFFLQSDDIPSAIIVSKSLFVSWGRKHQLSMNELFVCESKWVIIVWLQ